MTEAITDRRGALAAICFLVATVAFLALHPRLGITDSDCEGYVIGARSLLEGKGYVHVQGYPLSHWPPGYSWLLAQAADTGQAARLVNAVSVGVATAALALLAVQGGWPVAGAGALAAVFGFGLFRHLAAEVKPDMLTYALFLVGALLYVRDGIGWRLGALALWSALMPFKLIAMVFAPGVLLAEGFRQGWGNFLRTQWRVYLGAALVWLIFFGGIIWFNVHTTGHVTPPTIVRTTVAGFAGEVFRFFESSLRSGLVCWYGSVRVPQILLPYLALLLLGLAALASLRPSSPGALLRWMGGGVLAVSWILMVMRQYYAGPRLMGYGLLLLLAGLVPLATRLRLWQIFAAGTLLLAIYNAAAVSRLGANHPAYEASAKAAQPKLKPGQPVFSNAPILLWVHLGIPATGGKLVDAPPGAQYVEVTLPNYDAIAQPVNLPLPRDGSWRQVAAWDGGALFEKSAAAAPAPL
ncbi:MAG: Uncharacterized protein FD161_774 [Limisphaerales bacterium]|nr:MAG: Uncharacterized protein FD161_774 [Limisphaerales bacterium]KAG0510132.1 MAG: Uncharacterized protein E1N63_774 [Limisphaerales bacterium]TXT52975.1 MAG: Uncharacterized protein FD140_83 [Limisphaerales bacterium]